MGNVIGNICENFFVCNNDSKDTTKEDIAVMKNQINTIQTNDLEHLKDNITEMKEHLKDFEKNVNENFRVNNEKYHETDINIVKILTLLEIK